MKSKKHPKFKVSLPTVAAFTFIIVVLVVSAIIFRHAASNNATHTASFAFDTTKAPGWFAGDPISSDGLTGTPNASRIIAQGTQAHPGDCFVQYSYWANSTKDPAEALSNVVAATSKGSEFSLQPTSTGTYSMTTSQGSQSFQVHRYTLVGEDGAEVSRGNEFAFFKTGTGYIDIRGYCKTAEDLEVTNSVFSAVSFKQ